MPQNCPPAEATPMEGTLFRGIPNPPVNASHFRSHAEAEKPCDPRKCKSWGLSVWVSEADARHAQQALTYMQAWHIAAGQVVPSDGVVMPTPSNSQPNHHTFWLSPNRDISSKFQIVIEPLPEGGADVA